MKIANKKNASAKSAPVPDIQSIPGSYPALFPGISQPASPEPVAPVSNIPDYPAADDPGREIPDRHQLEIYRLRREILSLKRDLI